MSNSFPIPTSLKIGDEIIADRKSSVIVNGQNVTRYRIASTTSEDQTIIGQWITVDGNVNDTSVQYNMSTVRTKSTRKAAATRAVTETGTTDDETSVTEGETEEVVQETTRTYRTPEGVEFTIIPADTSGEYLSQGAADNAAVDLRNSFTSLASWYNTVFSDTEIFDERTSLNGSSIGRMNFVHGMPFQYTYLTDRRNGANYNFGKNSSVDGKTDTTSAARTTSSSSGDSYGRSFAKEIAFNTPIAVISPGNPMFMQPANRGLLGGAGIFQDTRTARGGIINMLYASDSQISSIQELLDEAGGEYQYYYIEYDDLEYYQYVNSLSMASAVFLGIDKMTFNGQTVGQFRWDEYNKDTQQDYNTFEQLIGMDSGTSFAFDPQGSISNTIQNSTTESMLANTFNDISAKAREVNFLAGYTGSGLSWIEKNADEASASISTNGGIIPDGLENVVERVKAWGLNSAKGMNIRFPEIWSDSSHAPSYEMECHFITPYATPFCIWRYVLVPFYHLFAMAAPRSKKSTSQYSAPFLIKAYSKGYFNVEMGMIDSITWKRFGDGDMISEGGIPTQIDVTITFKDLYHSLSVTSTGAGGINNVINFMNNAGLM